MLVCTIAEQTSITFLFPSSNLSTDQSCYTSSKVSSFINQCRVRSSYTMRTKCAISDAFVRDCVFAYCGSVAQYVSSLSAEHCLRLRNNAISDERVRDCALSRGKRPYYAHLTGKRILWPNHWLHGDKTLAGYRLDNCLSMPKYKSVLSLQHFRQYRFSGGVCICAE